MQKNEIYEIEITGMTDEGDGVGRVGSMAVFVPYTIEGEKVRILIIKVLKHYAYGKLLEVIKPSPHRTKAECPYFYQCGGCQLWHMDIHAELSYKREKVESCIRRIGGLDTVPEPVVCSKRLIRYRNKAQYPVTPAGIGFYRRNSHALIPVADCLIQGKRDTEVLAVIKRWMEEYRIAPYDENTNQGFLRHVYIREGSGEMLLVLVTGEKKFPAKNALIENILSLRFPVVGIVQNINEKPTNVVLGKESHILWGRGYLIDRIGEIQFKISPLSFYQVNRFLTRTLYEIAAAYACLSGKETLWDLYCGIGTIGLFMAQKAKKVIGVEVVEDAVENARENAALNGIENACYYCGKAENVVPELVRRGERADVVILDPPRKGCDTALLETLIKVKPLRIVYVSCKPSTLARDLKFLTENGYQIEKVTPVNMFPRSAHVETIVLLQNRNM